MSQLSERRIPHTRRFRWRTIPVGIIGGIGLIFVCMGLFMAVALGYATATGRKLYTPSPDVSAESIAMTIWAIAAGGWLTSSAWMWWRGRWWWAIAMVAAYFALMHLLIAWEVLPE